MKKIVDGGYLLGECSRGWSCYLNAVGNGCFSLQTECVVQQEPVLTIEHLFLLGDLLLAGLNISLLINWETLNFVCELFTSISLFSLQLLNSATVCLQILLYQDLHCVFKFSCCYIHSATLGVPSQSSCCISFICPCLQFEVVSVPRVLWPGRFTLKYS